MSDAIVFMLSPFGILTVGPLDKLVLFVKMLLSSGLIYVLVAPESALHTMVLCCKGGVTVSILFNSLSL